MLFPSNGCTAVLDHRYFRLRSLKYLWLDRDRESLGELGRTAGTSQVISGGAAGSGGGQGTVCGVVS